MFLFDGCEEDRDDEDVELKEEYRERWKRRKAVKKNGDGDEEDSTRKKRKNRLPPFDRNSRRKVEY